MATQFQNLSEYDQDKMPDKDKVFAQQYAIAVADWNPQITYSLLQGAIKTLIENGVKPSNINIVHVPGTFELTYAAKELLNDYICMIDNRKIHKYAAVITLGCVIQGETPHFDYVCQGVTSGITALNTMPDCCPVIFGVLTTNTLEQAQNRAGGIHGNKGVEAAITAIKMANIIW
ncbi:MAG: 6,7-dimethyl-8-ribityllumazine synthase [Paludibacter sp.]|nr:6,7-dimethyl-8-ribityllumazine synthase [Paludibacter sp.]